MANLLCDVPKSATEHPSYFTKKQIPSKLTRESGNSIRRSLTHGTRLWCGWRKTCRIFHQQVGDGFIHYWYQCQQASAGEKKNNIQSASSFKSAAFTCEMWQVFPPNSDSVEKWQEKSVLVTHSWLVLSDTAFSVGLCFPHRTPSSPQQPAKQQMKYSQALSYAPCPSPQDARGLRRRLYFAFSDCLKWFRSGNYS